MLIVDDKGMLSDSGGARVGNVAAPVLGIAASMVGIAGLGGAAVSNKEAPDLSEGASDGSALPSFDDDAVWLLGVLSSLRSDDS
eukprot:m.79584 g.79584  ORF g.79584 m.79584 type:complete len:84 (+) comp14520_c0_seq1:589-840(+)